jgi:capsular polysaccharide biosynthesis protein
LNLRNDDIHSFFKNAWKTILAFIFFGAICSLVYLFSITPQYQARAMLRVGALSSPQNLEERPIENIDQITTRFKFIAALSDNDVSSCGLKSDPQVEVFLIKYLKFQPVKNSQKIIEFNVNRSTPEQAKICAQSIANSMSEYHDSLYKAIEQDNKFKLNRVERKLGELKQFLANFNVASKISSPAYWPLTKEIERLEDEKIKLTSVTQLSNTQLDLPIEVLSHPVYPQRFASVLLGLFTGLISGILFALYKKTFLIKIDKVKELYKK